MISQSFIFGLFSCDAHLLAGLIVSLNF